MLLTLWPPSRFLYLLFLCFFSPTWGMRKPNLIWRCIKFPEFSENIHPPVKASPCRDSKPGEKGRFFEFEVRYMWGCGSLYGVWLSVTAPDLGHDNMWVSQASISVSAGCDTHAGLELEKQNYSVLLTLISISPLEWVCSSAEKMCYSVYWLIKPFL